MDDALKTVPGVTSKMLVKFGENDIKTVEDLAGCATDDLVGWTERKEGGEPTKHPGILDRQRNLARRRREHDHAGARHRRLDHRGRSRQEDRRGRGLRRSAGLMRVFRTIDSRFARRIRADDGAMSHACLLSLTPISTTDRGPTGPRPMRMCAVTRAVRPIDELIRFVVSPAGRGDPGSEAQAARPRPVGFGLASDGCGSGAA